MMAAGACAGPVFTPGPGGLGDHWFPDYGNGGYTSTHYDLDMSFNPTTSTIDATTHLIARATQNLSRFDLDLQGLNVTALRVDDRSASYTRQGHKLIITPAHGLRSGQRFDVAVSYSGVPQPVGTGATATGFLPTNDGAFTIDDTIASDTWFPNNDHPSDKASYTFRVTVPSTLGVIANGRLTSTQTHGGSTTFEWNEPSPMASYLATVDIGHWQIKSGQTPDGIPEYVAVDPQLTTQHADPLSYFWDTTAQVTDFWTKTFGPFPFDSTGAIADYTNIDGQPSGYAEETQTRPVYGMIEPETTIAHELAHQWFGDSVSITDFADIWLNEGFATWATWYWDGLHGGIPIADQARQIYSASDSSFWQYPATPASVNGGDRVYNGGAMALQFLRERVGDPTFFEILRTWTSTHRHHNATTAQFVALAQKISGQDLTHFFHDWIYSTSKPPLP